MPFPVDDTYIQATEKIIGATFPEPFRRKMKLDNGGELDLNGEVWLLHPIYDTSAVKRIKRTCNDIVRGTKAAGSWAGFPTSAIAIGENGMGDILVFVRDENDKLLDSVFLWRHETRELSKIAESFAEVWAHSET